jgi:hypothetical protein
MRALHLYLYADLHGADREMLQMTTDIDELLEEIKMYRLPAKTERLLLTYMESIGHYSKAEDSLYRLWEQGEDVSVEGDKLYRRLLLKSPEELEQGSLPMDEVEQGWKEWNRITEVRRESGA